ncbi:MAG: DNA/RNA nuclease SfsA, partial [Holophagales bacterium]|nr:DNA/RNA nuclease SfsA [Holophagales bacterium]
PMKLHLPLREGRLIRRYKRFLADVELDDGTCLTVHCPNSGAMTTCSEPGRPVVISDSGNPKRKLRYTLEMIRMGRTWVGVNTANPNRAVRAFVAKGRIPELAGYDTVRAEVPYGVEGRSRIDLLLEDPDGERSPCFVEIKNATYRVGEHAAFPDAVTVRGRKHLNELEAEAAAGNRAVIFFFVGRADCRRMRPADEVDPAYGETLRKACGAGVEPLAYRMRFSRRGVELLDRLPVDL